LGGSKQGFPDENKTCTLIGRRSAHPVNEGGSHAYALLAQSPSHQGALSQARAAISGFLKERCEVSVGYDAEDALRRLLADGLVTSDPDGNLTAIAPAEAHDHLDTLWDRLLDVDSLDRAASPGEA
jgi:hypothetical protein